MYKVLVVDDSAFMRQLIKSILEQTGRFSVMVAQTPLIALDRVRKFKFDVITIDYEMPYMNGVELIKKIKEITDSKILMISAYTHPGAHTTFEALSAGAFDYILKPSGEDEIKEFKYELIKKVTAACEEYKKIRSKETLEEIKGRKILLEESLIERAKSAKVVGIGISTGGPPVLEKMFKSLKSDFPLPILVVQHMPPNFTKAFAERLAFITSKCIKEAEDNEEVKPGCIYIAKGGYHLAVEERQGKLYTRVLDLEKIKSHKPSADILFSSIAEACEKDAIGIIMTGMGSDGSDGILEMRKKGAITIAQNEKTCVVFGMPKAAIEIDAIEFVMSPEEIVELLNMI
ncbi:protein-glutamate methylesterase/protein-glutamine glutaminase [Caldicellulosiruptor naganoensis]|uniref:Protein-glutamate methylesterase/protein-glutamine glutaminase n=1 Tax=Caldicellulosiruptor naganoensis TaxID=29324 RepID=A0ABY7BJX9_9FIRM|nr:chemotaxis response regulator protein-glutamate methylesterase [Caldicellulosiruptor naganoensis]WAM32728.1 chemotaxis response regulator protein-glutamate methylesterase [Caldicellulosiruptor naganoensis]